MFQRIVRTASVRYDTVDRRKRNRGAAEEGDEMHEMGEHLSPPEVV